MSRYHSLPGYLEAGGGYVRQPRVPGVTDGLAQRAEVVVGLHAARSLPLVADAPVGDDAVPGAGLTRGPVGDPLVQLEAGLGDELAAERVCLDSDPDPGARFIRKDFSFNFTFRNGLRFLSLQAQGL